MLTLMLTHNIKYDFDVDFDVTTYHGCVFFEIDNINASICIYINYDLGC
jgi:hypothetical protein